MKVIEIGLKRKEKVLSHNQLSTK